MSTPTTVKFQIAVPSTEGAEKVYTLTLSLLVEGATDGEITLTRNDEGEMPDGVTSQGDVPMIQDPPN